MDEIAMSVVAEFLDSDMSTLPQNVVMALKRIVWDDLSYLQRRELVRVMIEQATYSQEQLIFYININPQLYNSFLSAYHINHNNSPMEYTVNGDNVTIVRPVVLRRYTNTRFSGGRNGTLSITENNHLILKAFATAWKYRELYERDGDIHRIFEEERTSPRQFYRYLDVAYMNPDKTNEILSGKLKINVNDLFQIARDNQVLER